MSNIFDIFVELEKELWYFDNKKWLSLSTPYLQIMIQSLARRPMQGKILLENYKKYVKSYICLTTLIVKISQLLEKTWIRVFEIVKLNEW